MNGQIDEQLLTAYALGELAGADRAAIAAHLVGNPWARQFVADARATAHLLADELARESFGGLTDLQHVVIEQKLAQMAPARRSSRRSLRARRWNYAVLATSIAASVLIVCGVVAALVPFVHHRLEAFVGQKQASDGNGSHLLPFTILPNSGGPGDVAATIPKTSPSFGVRSSDPLDFDAGDREEAWVPQPDNRLADLDPVIGTEAGPGDRVGMHPSEPAKASNVASAGNASNGANAVPAAPTTPHDAPSPARPHVSSDNFASIPADQQSPDKIHSAVPSSPDGVLPVGDRYAHLIENPFVDARDVSISGFSAGVDSASYSNIRRFITHGKLPPADAVRLEEMLNYFPVPPAEEPGAGPLELQVELGACPWRPDRRLARVCVTARPLPPLIRPPVNLVFLIDVSPAMRKEKTKLPLLKQAIRQLAARLSERDRISIVAYSPEPGVVLSPTAGNDRDAIWGALARLDSGGRIDGGQSIEAAYNLARRNVSPEAVSRVILATDGQWNIGPLEGLAAVTPVVRRFADEDIALTVLGVGMTNLKDATLLQLAGAGNGSYAYVDTLAEARRVLADQVNGSLVTVADNVKVKVQFNPAVAASYRLLGYERRALSADDIASQSRTGGNLGAGQSVTALYEVIPVSREPVGNAADLLTATVTYVDPTTHAGAVVSAGGVDRATPLPRTSREFRFAGAVAEFGLMLRNSDYKSNATWSSVVNHSQDAMGPDETGYRHEFLNLVKKARSLATGR